MKKVEGILTICGVLMIIALPMFLMATGIGTSKIESYGEDLIRLNSYDENASNMNINRTGEIVDVKNYAQDFEALDGIEERAIQTVLNNRETINQKVMNISVVDDNIKKDYVVVLDESKEVVPAGIDNNEETKTVTETEPAKVIVASNNIEETNVPNTNSIENTEVEIMDVEIPLANGEEMPAAEYFTEEDSEDADELIIEAEDSSEMIVFDEEEVPQAIITENIEDNEVEEVEFKENVDAENAFAPTMEEVSVTSEEIIDDVLETEIDNEIDETSEIVTIDDNAVPEALNAAGGYESLEIEKVDDDYNVHVATVTYKVKDADGSDRIQTVIFSY